MIEGESTGISAPPSVYRGNLFVCRFNDDLVATQINEECLPSVSADQFFHQMLEVHRFSFVHVDEQLAYLFDVGHSWVDERARGSVSLLDQGT